ncbi:hypothetical protein C8R47DRAFT_675946 [Mycena vitilis]|nr:hypothetical protein C8R47DRAFT_675946 [Mycena vitilis]
MEDASLQNGEPTALISRTTFFATLPAGATPVHRLPPEILTRIFPLCASYDDPVRNPSVWMDSSAERQLERLAQKHLLDLAGVCSQWLALVMGTPSLWRSVEVDCSRWSSRHTDILAEVLQRSGATPLRVFLRHVEYARHSRALHLLVANSARWEEANLALNELGVDIVSAVAGNLPQLKLLRITSPGFDGFETAPLLTELCVWTADIPVIQWNQLKILELLGLRTLYGVLELEVFPRCSMLIELIVVISSNRTYTLPSDDEALTCDTVETFTLSGCTEDPNGYAARLLEGLLSILTLSSLQTLYLFPTVAPWQQEAFLGFSRRSLLSNTLKFLEFRGINIDAVDLVEILAELPSLCKLRLSRVAASTDCEMNDHLLRSLTKTADSFIVPSLIEISLHSHAPFAEKVLINFATSRWENPAREVQFNIFLWIAATVPDIKPATVAELQAVATAHKCNFSYRKLQWD